jgi:hypothetical protein
MNSSFLLIGTQVVQVDAAPRWSRLLDYHLNRHFYPGRPMKRRAQNFMAIDNAVQRFSKHSYIERSFDPNPALRTVSAGFLS